MTCDGTGLDPEQIDVPAFKAAEDKLEDALQNSAMVWQPRPCSLIDDGVVLGRDFGAFGKLAYKDFLIEE